MSWAVLRRGRCHAPCTHSEALPCTSPPPLPSPAGHPSGFLALGYMHLMGSHGLQRNYREALGNLKQAVRACVCEGRS